MIDSMMPSQATIFPTTAPLASKTVRFPPFGGATLSGEAGVPFPVSGTCQQD